MKIHKLSRFVLALCVFAAGCSLLMPDSPTKTFKTFVEASQKKDIEGIKKSLSSGTLKMMETAAKMENATLDEKLKSDDSNTSYKEMPEMRNEKITGDAATLEVKNRTTGEWDTIPFVKEDGKWKIAFDKFIEEMMKKLADDFTKPFSNDAGKTDSGNTAKP